MDERSVKQLKNGFFSKNLFTRECVKGYRRIVKELLVAGEGVGTRLILNQIP